MPAAKPVFPMLQDGHPLAQHLEVGYVLSEGAGGVLYDKSRGGGAGSLNAGAAWSAGPEGAAVSCSGGGNFQIPFPAVGGDDGFALVITHQPTVWAGTYTALLDGDSRIWSIFIDTDGNNSYNGSMLPTPFSYNFGMATGSPWQFIYTRDRYNVVGTYYVNGKAVTAAPAANNASPAATVHFGDNPSAGGTNYSGAYSCVLLFVHRSPVGTYPATSPLSAGDVASLYAKPYALFTRPQRRLFRTTAVPVSAYPASLLSHW